MAAREAGSSPADVTRRPAPLIILSPAGGKGRSVPQNPKGIGITRTKPPEG